MVLLTSADLLFASYSLLICIHDLIDGFRIQFAIIAALTAFTLSVEISIAVGFAFACHGSARCTRLLSCCLLPCALASASMTAYGTYAFSDKSWWRVGSGVLILFFCAISLACYVYGFVAAARLPKHVRRRCWIQGSCYIVSFLVTFAPTAVLGIVEPVPFSEIAAGKYTSFFLQVVFCLMGLNGFTNVCTYMFWVRKSVVVEKRLHAEGSGISAYEELLITTYYDLKIHEDEEALQCRQAVIAAVVDARQVREQH